MTDTDTRLDEWPNPLNIVDALEKYAVAINKSRDELTETDKMQAIVNAVLARGEN